MICIVLSCSNSGGNPDDNIGVSKNYYIKANFNGVNKIFSKELGAHLGLEGTKLSVFAKESDANFPQFELEIWRESGNIEIDTYIENNDFYSIKSIYNINGFTLFNNFNDIEDFKITISSISATEVKGCFVGLITKNDDTNENIIITNGEFYAPLN